MSINSILQDIAGNKEDEVVDVNYSLAEVWPVGDSSFPLLQYVDAYGNTIFNRAQLPEVKRELDLLASRVSTDEQKRLLLRISELATKGMERPHKFLRFSGD
jgi:capsid portal protein